MQDSRLRVQCVRAHVVCNAASHLPCLKQRSIFLPCGSPTPPHHQCLGTPPPTHMKQERLHAAKLHLLFSRKSLTTGSDRKGNQLQPATSQQRGWYKSKGFVPTPLLHKGPGAQHPNLEHSPMAGARYAHNALIVGLVQPAGVVRGILATPGAEQNESLFGDAENVQKPRPEMCKVQSSPRPREVPVPIRFRPEAPAGMKPLMKFGGPCAIMPHGPQRRRLCRMKLLAAASHIIGWQPKRSDKKTPQGNAKKAQEGNASPKGSGAPFHPFSPALGRRRSAEVLL